MQGLTMKGFYLVFLTFIITACSVSGDNRVDMMIEKMRVEVIHDIPINQDNAAGHHIGGKIHMKPRSFYPKKQQYLLVLLHEIAHHIGSKTKRISYVRYKQDDYRLLEELIANQYAMQMIKVLGYQLRFGYYELNEQYTVTLKNRYGYTDMQIKQYVDNEVKKSMSISKRLLK